MKTKALSLCLLLAMLFCGGPAQAMEMNDDVPQTYIV